MLGPLSSFFIMDILSYLAMRRFFIMDVLSWQHASFVDDGGMMRICDVRMVVS